MCLGHWLILWNDLGKGKWTWDFGTLNVRSLYRAGSLVAASRELARYKLDLVGVQKVRWDKWSTVWAGDCIFIYGKGNENHQLETGFFFVHHWTVERVEFISDRMWYVVLRGRWCNIILLNVRCTNWVVMCVKMHVSSRGSLTHKDNLRSRTWNFVFTAAD